MLVMIYQAQAREWETHDLDAHAPLPHAPALRADAFCSPGCGCLLWTDARLLEAYTRLCAMCGRSVPVRYGFRRPAAFLHAGQSAHCAGLALDLVLWEGERQRDTLAELARLCGFSHIEPPFLSPNWLHAECVIAPPAWPRPGYPALRLGDAGVHVLVLQDLLCAAGLYEGGLTGLFLPATRAALVLFQRLHDLPTTGRADAAVWEALLRGGARHALLPGTTRDPV